jgi:ketosteroid isomerase-like protein
MASAVVVVEAWHEALNVGESDRLANLVSDDVEVGGPRGSGRGIDLFRDWVGRAGIHLEPLRIFRRGDIVVVEQSATWRSPETGQSGEPTLAASVFTVRDGLIRSIMRYDDLDTALQIAGLTMEDEIEEGV